MPSIDGRIDFTRGRRYVAVEAVLALLSVAVAAFMWQHDESTGAYFFAFAGSMFAILSFKTLQIDVTIRDVPNRIDRGQSMLAQMSGRQFKRASWARRPVLVVLTEHYLYVFESTIRPCEPVVRRAYNDLMEFGLGEGQQRAALRIGLPDRTVVISGLITSEVAGIEAVINEQRPTLIKQPIAPVLAAQLKD